MHKIRVYVDTSVFGGVEDNEFSSASRRFFDRVVSGDYIILVSEESLQELAKAPQAVKSLWEGLPSEAIEEVSLGDEAKALGQAYIEAGVLGSASVSDALHVAAATVAGADLILSWNFKHIVNFKRIKGFNGVNLINGYHAMP